MIPASQAYHDQVLRRIRPGSVLRWPNKTLRKVLDVRWCDNPAITRCSVTLASIGRSRFNGPTTVYNGSDLRMIGVDLFKE